MGGFRSLATNTAGLGAPAALTYVSSNASELLSIRTGPEQQLTFAVTPAGPNGGAETMAQVQVDDLEVTMTYVP